MTKAVPCNGVLSRDSPVLESAAAASPQETAWRQPIALACLSLLKPRVVGLVLFTAVATAFAAAGGVPPWSALTLLLLTGFLTAGGAAALNHYFDRDLDGGMQRTKGRPLVTGQIRHPEIVLIVGTMMIVAGLRLAAWFNPMLALFLFAGAFVYVAVYTLWLKRRSPLNIVIGGLAGSCAVLGGWVTVTPGLNVVPLLLAFLVFLWTPAHFWSLALARSTDYQRARVPMLPAVTSPKATGRWVLVHVLWTVGLSLWLQPVASFGAVYVAVALGIGLTFLWMGLRLWQHPDTRTARPLFKFSGVYLGLLFLAVLIDSVWRAV